MNEDVLLQQLFVNLMTWVSDCVLWFNTPE